MDSWGSDVWAQGVLQLQACEAHIVLQDAMEIDMGASGFGVPQWAFRVHFAKPSMLTTWLAACGRCRQEPLLHVWQHKRFQFSWLGQPLCQNCNYCR